MEIIVAIIGSGALSAIISGIFSIIGKRKDRKSALSQGVQVILWDRLDHLLNKYINDGCISTANLKKVIEMHSAYKKLGGNGYLDRLMEVVQNDLRIV